MVGSMVKRLGGSIIVLGGFLGVAKNLLTEKCDV